ncbi:MAG: DUF1553 domain-containing protein [Planctomycetota bacterium]|nr:DUF1553 domain-containing protein [Planctomycetota bacterium]
MPRLRPRFWLLNVAALLLCTAGSATAPRAWAAPPPTMAPTPASSATPTTKPYAHAADEGDPLFDTAPAEPFKPSANAREAARALDALILADAARRKLEPAPLIGDEAFLRRLSIDLAGRIPTARERREFLAEPAETRRAKLVQRLLASGRFVQRLTTFFDDILRIRSRGEGGDSLRQFVTASIRENLPYDEMIRRMLTARGTLNDPAMGFLIADGPNMLAMPGVISQQFLGIRMNCAQCHDHPFDSWTQKQYYSLAAYFQRTNVYYRVKPAHQVFVAYADRPIIRYGKSLHDGSSTNGISPQWPFRLVGSDDPRGNAAAPRRVPVSKTATGDEIAALAAGPAERGMRGLDAGMVDDLKKQAKADIDLADPERQQLAAMITGPRNRYFAWNIVNRLWADMLGTGIVSPIDDFRSGNPPRNPALLNRLADEFVASGHDLRFLVEMIVSTEAYQRSRVAGSPEDRRDRERAYVAAPLRRMGAEALYDSLITAGHLEQPKHRPGANMVEVTYTVEERRLRPSKMEAASEESAMQASAGNAPATQPAMEASTGGGGQTRVISDYSAEDVDAQIASVLTSPSSEKMVGMADMKEQAAQESQMMKRMQSEENVEYVSRRVTVTRDVNPSFHLASELETPAQSDHVLRLLGQPTRATLGEKRDATANIRQSLVLLNGKMVNEAARVGELEPMDALMDDRKPADEAIDLAYAEAYSRLPTAKERAAAAALVAAGGNRRDGIADLRWVLLNAMEFRYLP